jgi:flagellar motor switch protein FliM
VPVFDCYYGTSNGKYSLRIDKLLTAGNTSWLGDHNV